MEKPWVVYAKSLLKPKICGGIFGSLFPQNRHQQPRGIRKIDSETVTFLTKITAKRHQKADGFEPRRVYPPFYDAYFAEKICENPSLWFLSKDLETN